MKSKPLTCPCCGFALTKIEQPESSSLMPEEFKELWADMGDHYCFQCTGEKSDTGIVCFFEKELK